MQDRPRFRIAMRASLINGSTVTKSASLSLPLSELSQHLPSSHFSFLNSSFCAEENELSGFRHYLTRTSPIFIFEDDCPIVILFVFGIYCMGNEM